MFAIGMPEVKLFTQLLYAAGAVMVEKLGEKIGTDPDDLYELFEKKVITEKEHELLRRRREVRAKIELMEWRLPGLRNFKITCPVDACTVEAPLKTVIILLNDVHGWSRGRIADWLESLPADLEFSIADEGGDEHEVGY